MDFLGGAGSFWDAEDLGIIFLEFFVGILKHIFLRDFTRKKWGFSQHNFKVILTRKYWDFYSMMFRGIPPKENWGFLKHDFLGNSDQRILGGGSQHDF